MAEDNKKQTMLSIENNIFWFIPSIIIFSTVIPEALLKALPLGDQQALGQFSREKISRSIQSKERPFGERYYKKNVVFSIKLALSHLQSIEEDVIKNYFNNEFNQNFEEFKMEALLHIKELQPLPRVIKLLGVFRYYVLDMIYNKDYIIHSIKSSEIRLISVCNALLAE